MSLSIYNTYKLIIINKMFVMVGNNDVPLYETNLTSVVKEEITVVHHFALHAALDVVDEKLNGKDM